MTVPNPVQNLDAIPDELSLSRTSFNMGQTAARTLAGVASGALNMNAFAGKSSGMSVDIGGPQSKEDGSPPGGFSLTATPTGGTAPYTYLWAIVSTSNTFAASFTSTTAQSTSLSNSPASVGVASVVTVHCAATDAHGVVATSSNAAMTYTSP